MNAKHARPLAAFGLLAISAAFITGTGLRASHSTPGAVGPSTQANASRPPELVLGGVLEARTNRALLHPLAPDLWATGSADAARATAVQVASPGAGGTQKARTGGTGEQHDAKVQSHPSTSTTHATATATSTATATGHGKGRGNDGGGGRPTTTVTAAATPTGHAGGTGKGPSSDHGH